MGQLEQPMLDPLRRFNRTVTQRVGALNDDFLARRRPLGQARLLWAEVERLLTASAFEVKIAGPGERAAQACLNAYYAELPHRFDHGFDPALSTPVQDAALRPPSGLLLLATLRGEPVGIGGLRFHGDGVAEVKRMWVAPIARRTGLGRRILAELEGRAAERGVRVLRLETNHALTEAIGLYKSAGYQEVAPFNDEAYAQHWFEKILGRPEAAGAA